MTMNINVNANQWLLFNLNQMGKIWRIEIVGYFTITLLSLKKELIRENFKVEIQKIMKPLENGAFTMKGIVAAKGSFELRSVTKRQ